MTTPAADRSPSSRPAIAGPPAKHQLAPRDPAGVFPTPTVLTLALGDRLSTLIPVMRTFVLATMAVPIVIYGLMSQLHKVGARVLARITLR